MPESSIHSPAKKEKLAIIGAGVAGITAAQLLQDKYTVSLFDKNNYLGGHTNTIVLENGPDAGLAVDTGFIVTNPLNYPYFQKLLSLWNVSLRNSDMSFSYMDRRDDFCYGTANLSGLVARKKNLISPKFWALLKGILKLNAKATKDLQLGNLSQKSLGSYLKESGFGKTVVDCYLIPMGAAIWSASPHQLLEYPAEAYFKFWDNHRLLQLFGRTIWQTVEGGSFAYVKAFKKQFKGEITCQANVKNICREADSIHLEFNDKPSLSFDKVVIASHADEALKLLAAPTALEKKTAGCLELFSKQNVFTHRYQSSSRL